MKTPTCKLCNKEFKKYTTTQKYCSPKCLERAEAIKTKEKKKIARERKKISISALTKKADKLWSETVRSEWRCAYCWSTENLNAHHIVGRRNKATRWLPVNWICLCSLHHTFSSDFSAHQTPVEFTYWLESTMSRAYLENLIRLSRKPLAINSTVLQNTIEMLQSVNNSIDK